MLASFFFCSFIFFFGFRRRGGRDRYEAGAEGGNSFHLRRVVGDVRAASGPHGRVGDALDQFEGDDAPRRSDPRNVQESNDVAAQSQAQDLSPEKKTTKMRQSQQ